ncbi:PAS domain S-box protein [Paenibacillus solisilvae]|uniref:histidine kinase n=1 Tax=Paenibacillus solisilvae TaxID=2486751 RepID=A0ABW0W3Q3_9BACL
MRQKAVYANKLLAKKYKEMSKSIINRPEGNFTIWSHLNELLDESLTCVYLTQEDKIIYVNNNLCRMFGYTQQEMLRMHPTEFVHPDDHEKLNQEVRNRLQGEERKAYTLRGKRKDGSLFYYETKSRAFKYRGQPALLGTLVDVTNSVQANQMIQENDLRYQRLIRYLPESIVVHDGQYVLYVNNAGKALFGITEEDIQSLCYIYTLIHPDSLEQSIERVNRVLQTDDPNDFTDVKLITKDRRVIDAEVSSIRIHNFQGHEYVVQSVFRDLTDRKKEEEALIKAEKLSIAGQMAAGIAHEIRNPLTSLKGFSQFLKSKTSNYHEYFDIMLTELDRINAIVQEFMALAKPQANQFKSHDLVDILESVHTLLETQSNLNNVQIVTGVNSDHTRISCDENQLKQVFINIIKNAIEAMPGGGKVVINLHSKQAGVVMIQITDQGVGIPSELLDKLGGPFFTTKSSGTGLGLMICQRIIQAHQGTLSIESELGKGTTVTIELPIHCSNT